MAEIACYIVKMTIVILTIQSSFIVFAIVLGISTWVVEQQNPIVINQQNASSDGDNTYQIDLVKVHLELPFSLAQMRPGSPVHIDLTSSLELILYSTIDHHLVGIGTKRKDLDWVVRALDHLFPHAFTHVQDFCNTNQNGR